MDKIKWTYIFGECKTLDDGTSTFIFRVNILPSFVSEDSRFDNFGLRTLYEFEDKVEAEKYAEYLEKYFNYVLSEYFRELIDSVGE